MSHSTRRSNRSLLPTVLIDSSNIAQPMRAGIGQVCLQYASAIARYQPDEFNFQFLKHPGNRLLRTGPYEQISARWNFHYFKDKLLRRGHRAQKLHYTGQNHTIRHVLSGHACFDISAHSATPLIWTIHDDFVFHDAPKYNHIVQRIYKLVEQADAIVSISEYTKLSLNKRMDLRHKKQAVIYHGVNPPMNPLRPKWLRGSRPFFLTLGQLIEYKNLHILLPMMLQMPDYDLVLAGKSNNRYTKDLQRHIVAMGLGERVITPGLLTESEKAWLLKNCAAFLHPSLREGFGLPVIEAFHMGKPVFCSRNTALVEIGGKHAYFWDNYEPAYLCQSIMVRLGTPADKSARDARRKWAAQFTWKKNLEAYLELYRHVHDGQHRVTAQCDA